MSQFIEAADAIRTIAKRLEGFQIAAQALEQIGSVDQAAKEAQAARDKAVKEAEKAKANLNYITEQIVAAEATKAALLADTKVAADAMLAEAESNASRALAKTKDEILAAREAYNVSLKASIDEAKGEVAKQKDRASKAKEKADEIEAEIVAKQGQLDSLNAMLAELKAKLGA